MESHWARSLLVASILLVLTLVVTAPSAKPAAAQQAEPIYLANQHSQLCLEIYGFSQENFATANQWDCWGGPNQTLLVTRTADGYFELRLPYSNKCLEDLNWSTANGAPIGQYSCHRGDNQKWSGQFVNGATFVIQNKFSHKCLDLYAWGTSNGDKVVQWDCHYGANQQWTMSSAGSQAATNLHVVSQSCTDDNRVKVSFGWVTSRQGNQWIDLSLQNNNFLPGTFLGIGPQPAGQSSFDLNGLLPGFRHYVRVNTQTSQGWRTSTTLAFDTRGDCAVFPSATVVRTLPTTERVVGLTFDAGSDAAYTSMILDTLQRNGIRAAFGITGRWAEANPQLVKRIAAAGHIMLNHSYDHPSFTGFSTSSPPLSRYDRWVQLSRTDAIIQNLTGLSTKPYFRPPYGDYDASVNTDAGAEGYGYNVMWSVDSYGWRGLPSQEIVSRVLSLVQPGSIVIFHVGSESQDGPALQAVIDGLRAMGYSFASLDQYFD